MARFRVRQFAARLVGVTLALSMLASPTLAQLTAAEACRERCTRIGASASAACCCKDAKPPSSPANPQLDHQDTQVPADRAPAGAQYCPGCNARPLIAGGERTDLSIDATPLFAVAVPSLTTCSADVALSIFHPPRA